MIVHRQPGHHFSASDVPDVAARRLADDEDTLGPALARRLEGGAALAEPGVEAKVKLLALGDAVMASDWNG